MSASPALPRTVMTLTSSASRVAAAAAVVPSMTAAPVRSPSAISTPSCRSSMISQPLIQTAPSPRHPVSLRRPRASIRSATASLAIIIGRLGLTQAAELKVDDLTLGERSADADRASRGIRASRGPQPGAEPAAPTALSCNATWRRTVRSPSSLLTSSATLLARGPRTPASLSRSTSGSSRPTSSASTPACG